MDVAKRVARWMEQPPEQWLTAANRYLPPVLSAVLVVAIAYNLAALTWALMPGEPLDAPPPAVAAAPTGAGATRARADYAALRQAHLFGKAPEEAPQPRIEVLDAPDTTLSLRLTGVVAEDEQTGWAFIVSEREERTYRTGQSIEGGSGATLHSVYADRVILERGGALETLRLPELSNGGGSSGLRVSTPPPPPAPPPDPVPDPSEGGSLSVVINDNAAALANVIRANFHAEGGQMIGFRVNPGRNRDAFAELGLEPGDVVTDINGIALDTPAAGLQLFEMLSETTMANVTVMRDGAMQILVIDTSQLESLAEGRQ